MKIIKTLKFVDEVFLSVDEDSSVAQSLRQIAKAHPGSQLFFAKGGDRNADNIPEGEKTACQDFNIKIINGVGGDKIQSSSWLIKNATKNKVI